MIKHCSKCNITKSITEFSKDRSTVSGYRNICKLCDRKKVKNYYQSHKESESKKDKEYRAKHPERIINKNRKWYLNNKDYVKSYNTKYRDTHREKDNEKCRNYRAKRYGTSDKISSQEWENLKIYYKHTCLACGKIEPEIKLTLDHVMPLSKGGKNVIENAQPLCKSCNSSKNDKYIDYRFIPIKIGV